MTLRQWLGFLIGRADCIEVAARSRGTLALGLLFVLSAGLAREYDQEDLLHEPWHALLPLVVSLATSFVLYLLIQCFTSPRSGEPRDFWRVYLSFLGLYWLMAPMAWIYAFPAERLLSDADAVQINLWLLFVVSVWRVSLMTRIIRVVWKAPGWFAFSITGFFSLSLACIGLAMMPTPMIGMMGGIRLSAAEETLALTKMLLLPLFVMAWPFFFLAVVPMIFIVRIVQPALSPATLPPNRPLYIVAVAGLLFFLALLPFTQPEQLRRTHAERLLKSGKIAEGLEYINQLGLAKFPPYWDPPPRVTYYGQRLPDIGAVIESHLAKPLPENLESVYFGKLVNAIADQDRDLNERLRYVRLLLQLPRAAEVVSRHRYRSVLKRTLISLPDGSPERKDLLALLESVAEGE